MKANRYVSVICEYNPFHFGHEFQLNVLKNEFDGVVCIMSGDIVQRGSLAIANKFIRAQAALNCGANLVLELPIPFCCSSAKNFAASGVHIAECIGSDFLAFGCEDDSDTLRRVFDLVSNPEFSIRLTQYIINKGSFSYPKALQALITEELGEEIAAAMTKPNNILALEYLTSLDGKSVKPFFVNRSPDFKSSSEIRSAKSGEELLALLPQNSKAVFEKHLNRLFPRNAKALDSFFIGTLRTLRAKGIKGVDFYSVPEDLYQKIVTASADCPTVDDLISACCDKTYTSARIHRAINAICFGITCEQVHELPSFTTVLAADERGREILKRAKKLEKIDIITKPVRATSASDITKKQYLFSKSVEDIISLSDIMPESADKGRTPYIIC